MITQYTTAQYKVSEESKRLLKELNQSDVRFAHWKGNTHLQESLEGKSDIELLIYPEDKHTFEGVMTELGYKKLVSPPWSTYPNVEDWIGFDYNTGALLHLHTHYALTTGVEYAKYISIPWLDVFFNHLQTDKLTGWPIPRPELEMIILLLRLCAKLPVNSTMSKALEIPLTKQNELIKLLKCVDTIYLTHLCRELHLKEPVNLNSRIEKILTGHYPNEIITLAQHFAEQLSYIKNSSSIFFKSLYFKYYLKITKAFNKIIGPIQYKKRIIGGGKIIALIGSDGSGKSTLSNDITKWLIYKIDTHYFYMGKHPFIKSYDKKIYSKIDVLANNTLISRILKKAVGNFYYVIMIKHKSDMFKVAKELRKEGSIIICDRFPQKNIPGINDGPKLQNNSANWSSKLELKLFDKLTNEGVDLVFRLIVSPEVAYERKPEHDYEMIDQKCKNILNISYQNSLLIDLDSDQPYEEVLLTLKREIWKYL